jgi:hypothetical protein
MKKTSINCKGLDCEGEKGKGEKGVVEVPAARNDCGCPVWIEGVDSAAGEH